MGKKDINFGWNNSINELSKLPKSNTENNNPYKLSKTEYDKMVSLGSNTVILSNSTGIGITVKCLVNNEWIDITDLEKR